MELLNKNMEEAVNQVDADDHMKELIRNILYQERCKKEYDWDNDAAKWYQEILDKEEFSEQKEKGEIDD